VKTKAVIELIKRNNTMENLLNKAKETDLEKNQGIDLNILIVISY
jgi:hypothetical protein